MIDPYNKNVRQLIELYGRNQEDQDQRLNLKAKEEAEIQNGYGTDRPMCFSET